MTVRQAIQLTLYTTRSLKRDETAGYIRLVRASGENVPDSVMRDEEGDGIEGDRSPIDGFSHLREPSGGRFFRLSQIASRGRLVSEGCQWKRPERLLSQLRSTR